MKTIPNQANAPEPLDRRQFLARSLAAGAAAVLPGALPGAGARARERQLNVAFVGIGNRGNDLVKTFAADPLVKLAAFCDVDLLGPHTAETRQMFPAVPRFQDFRQMFAAAGNTFEAVVIAGPDHAHFALTMQAMAQGKHVYVEKPLAHSFAEVELLMAAAARHRVVTQMGNQGHSGNNYHQFKAWSEAGVIKDVTRIDLYMNSPRRWHGWTVDGFPNGEPVPPTLDWDLWHMNVPLHPFSSKLHPANWRSWYDFGDGALGDWAPHMLDTAHRFLELGLPKTIEAIRRDGPNEFIFPQASTLRFDFPARGSKPPVEVFWYDGVENLPPLPPEAATDAGSGTATARDKNGKFIYAKGTVFKGGTHGDTLRMLPESRMQAMAEKLPRITGRFSDHFQNFVLACLGREETRSPFSVSGPLTQVLLLGVIAQRLGGRLEFDPVARRFTNSERANQLLRGLAPRPGWERYYDL